MKVLIAPDSFKDALDARSVAEAMAQGVRDAVPAAEIVICPMGDGGEGTGRLLADALGAEVRQTDVLNPLGRSRAAEWWLDAHSGEALVEMAEASGLHLLRARERDAILATSFGTGQLLRAAVDAGCRSITLCAGGSASVDGGAGCLQALGWRLLDRSGETIAARASGGTLREIVRINPPLRAVPLDVRILCDVTNPLLGPRGAANVFAPQKAATREQVRRLDAGLTHWANVLRAYAERDVASLPGSGAAGGLPAGLAATLGAKLLAGFEEVARRVAVRARAAGCNLCLTGEGRLDDQTAAGKVVAGMAVVGREVGARVVAFVGAVHAPGEQGLRPSAAALGLDEIVEVTPGGATLEQALPATATNLRRAVGRFLQRGGWS